MALDDTRRAAIEAYLGVGAGYAMNDLEYLFYADMLANGLSLSEAERGAPSTLYVATDTIENILLNYDMVAYDGYTFRVTNVGTGSGMDFIAYGGNLVPKNLLGVSFIASPINSVGYINLGGTVAWSQSGNTVTGLWTAHGLTAEMNGSRVYLVQGTLSTGVNIATGWYDGFLYIDPDHFSFTSAVSQSGSGTLGANLGVITPPWTYQYPVGLLKANAQINCAALIKSRNASGNKAYTLSYSGVLTNTVNQASTAVYNVIGSNNIYFLFGGVVNFIVQTLSTAFQTDTNRTWTATMQNASITDWSYIRPFQATYGSRQ